MKPCFLGSGRLGTVAFLLLALAGTSAISPVSTAEEIGSYRFRDVGSIEGYPIFQVGNTSVYRVSPTFYRGLTLQRDNTRPMRKVVPKRSYEIRSNFVGIMPTALPNFDGFTGPAAIGAHRLIDGNRASGYYYGGTPTESSEDS